ncbi:hypothetical protein ROZALSC1DRAFT_25249 [Rozella allomycis CSF55]|uniref:Uncharacterized protein n=1 Tax=Rozella allomycis (strain CSF55) TaxID=988480 RepID=A0A4P9YC82_ROZAC|nr:hypothetical protein ROZALSC1DRAFT_25249 [Rozella allomycis CSF55]
MLQTSPTPGLLSVSSSTNDVQHTLFQPKLLSRRSSFQFLPTPSHPPVSQSTRHIALDDFNDEDDWARLQYLEFTTKSLVNAPIQEIDEEVSAKSDTVEDAVIETEGLKGLQNLQFDPSFASLQSIKDQLKSSKELEKEELDRIFRHVADITERIFDYNEADDDLPDDFIDRMIYENVDGMAQKSNMKLSRSASSKIGRRKSSVHSRHSFALENGPVFLTETSLGEMKRDRSDLASANKTSELTVEVNSSEYDKRESHIPGSVILSLHCPKIKIASNN